MGWKVQGISRREVSSYHVTWWMEYESERWNRYSPHHHTKTTLFLHRRTCFQRYICDRGCSQRCPYSCKILAFPCCDRNIFIIYNSFFQLLVTYDPTKYSAIAGDGGPNVRSAKIKINAHFPWILNIYDPCHNLNLFLKDLGKLFKDASSFCTQWLV